MKKIPKDIPVFKIILILFVTISILIFVRFTQKKEAELILKNNVIIEEEVIVPILVKEIYASNLTDQQLIKAKAMTEQAQIKEFGGIIVYIS